VSSFTTADLIRFERDAVDQFGLYEFGKWAFPHVEGRPLIETWHLEVLCRHLEAVVEQGVERLLINVPPGTGKSSWLSVLFPAWAWIRRPWLRFMFASFDDGLVLRDARKTRTLVNSDWYQARWCAGMVPGIDPEGNPCTGGCTIDATRSSAAKAGEYWTTAGGLRFSTTIGSKGTGWHAHIQVVDDPHKASEATKNAKGLEDAAYWYDETMSSRRIPGAFFARIVDMQRLSKRDLSEHCIKKGDYHHLCLPMVGEAGHPYRDEDDHREEGELLCPALKDADAVEDEGRELGPNARAAQHRQTPQPRGGKVFKRDWFVHFWRELPARIQRVQSWDHTFGSLGETASWVVGDDWGRAGADYYLIDEVRARCEFPVMKAMLRSFSAKHPRTVTKLVEDKAAGKLVVQDLRSEISGLVEVRVSGSTGGKLARAETVTGYAEAGNIWLPHPTDARLDGRPHPCPWVHDWIENICDFEGLPGDVADQVDTMSQAITRLRGSLTVSFSEAMKRARKEHAA